MSAVLIHIGYRKTGSTWLQQHVFRSPDLGFARLRTGPFTWELVVRHDLSFDADTTRARLQPRVETPLAAGLTPVLSTERFSGSLGLRFHDSVRIADRLAALFPDGRVLMVVREQRAMILSTYAEYVMQGGMLPLESYLAGGWWWSQQAFELEQFEYDRLISHYQGRFGEANVLVLPYELFRRDGFDFVSRIVDFAATCPAPGAVESLPFGLVVYPANPPLTIAAKRQLNRFARQTIEPFEGGKLVRTLATRAGKLAPAVVNTRLRRRMAEAVSSAVGDHYRESNARTSRLIGFDLGEYGYDVRAGADSAESAA
jgi:hypothetical protein